MIQSGNSAEFYLDPDNQSKSAHTHRQILKQFGAEDDYADEMLNDQGTFGFQHNTVIRINVRKSPGLLR